MSDRFMSGLDIANAAVKETADVAQFLDGVASTGKEAAAFSDARAFDLRYQLQRQRDAFKSAAERLYAQPGNRYLEEEVLSYMRGMRDADYALTHGVKGR